jgi:hypothetical protein
MAPESASKLPFHASDVLPVPKSPRFTKITPEILESVN